MSLKKRTLSQLSLSDCFSGAINTGNNRQINTMENILPEKRQRNAPQRFGKPGELNLSDSFDDPLNLKDNSFDDKDFVPDEPPAKIVATCGVVKKTLPKKAKTISTDKIVAKNCSSTSQQCFDDEFDLLTKSSSVDVTPDVTATVSLGISEKIPEKSSEISDNKNSIELLLDYCQRIVDRLEHQSARISIIEDVMRDDNSGAKRRKTSFANKTEESRSFAITNRLPITNFDDLDILERNLNNIEFKHIAVSSLHLFY